MQRIEADWLSDAATQRIFELLSATPTFVVGGCVRNALLNVPVKDVDFATAAHPETVSKLAEKAGMRVIPTGLSHGTVTVIAQDQPFEVTTFRRDVATDGRRATVAYAESLEEDALRRDFTVNAIYADAKGALYDPTGGLADIKARRIRFIEDAERRIQEDYLRSLRFFRFCAWYADPAEGIDPEALNAIARNLAGLETLSRERVGSELLRLLGAPDPAPAVSSMRQTGVLASVLPGADDTAMGPLIVLEQDMGVQPNAIRRLAALGGDVQSLRLSRADSARVSALRAGGQMSPGALGYAYGFEVGRDALLVFAATMGQHFEEVAIKELEKGAKAEFPVRSSDLMDQLEGKALGDALRRLEREWIDSGFTLSRKELLSKG